MKILRGNLTETRYDFPDEKESKPMDMISKTVYEENGVAYMADELGLHRMSNEGSDYAVSLHREPLPLFPAPGDGSIG
jgi:cysteine dioxygenase